MSRNWKFILFGIGIIMITLILIGCGSQNSSQAIQSTPTPSAEQQYLSTLNNQGVSLSEAMNGLSPLLSNEDVFNAQWRINVGYYLRKLQSVYKEAVLITPPPSMANIHYKYLEALRHYDTASRLMSQGIDNLDADFIRQAGAELNSGTQDLKEATILMNQHK